MSYDIEANAAYLAIEQDIPSGSVTENVVVERAGRGDIVAGSQPQQSSPTQYRARQMDS